MDKRPVLLGVPFNSNGTQNGVSGAPKVLRGMLREYEWQSVSWVGDTTKRDQATGLKNYSGLSNMIEAVSKAVSSMSPQIIPILIGGDCGVLLGALQGAGDQCGEIGLVFIDGHEDAWPPAKSPTGETADSEMGLAVGLWDDIRIESFTHTVPLDRVAILGPRDHEEIEEAEVSSLKDRTCYCDADLLLEEVDTCISNARALMRENAFPYWLHIDLDVLSSDEFSAVDYPQEGGISWDMLRGMTKEFLNDPLCVGCSVVIYNPDLDQDLKEASRVASYLRQVLPA